MKLQKGRFYASLPDFLLPLIGILSKRNYGVYLVGGIPRDILIGKTPKDADFAVSSDLSKIEKIIEDTYSIKKKVKTRFLTINYQLTNGNVINIAHFRKEYYPQPAMLPIVEITHEIEEDAKRRDFTINSIYYDIYNATFIDPLSGIRDLKKRILKINYSGSFKDDPTRIFRAIRYKIRLNLKYDHLTLTEIKENKDFVNLLTPQRFINEIKKISTEKQRISMLMELDKLKIPYINITNENKLKTLDRLLPYTQDTWLFFAAFAFVNISEKWPLTRKEKKTVYWMKHRPINKEEYTKCFKELTKNTLYFLWVFHEEDNFRKLALTKKIIEEKHYKIKDIKGAITCILNLEKINTKTIHNCLQVP